MLLMYITIIVVALRKESVDRNEYDKRTDRSNHVALRKESVDRNAECLGLHGLQGRRSPQGERG